MDEIAANLEPSIVMLHNPSLFSEDCMPTYPPSTYDQDIMNEYFLMQVSRKKRGLGSTSTQGMATLIGTIPPQLRGLSPIDLIAPSYPYILRTIPLFHCIDYIPIHTQIDNTSGNIHLLILSSGSHSSAIGRSDILSYQPISRHEILSFYETSHQTVLLDDANISSVIWINHSTSWIEVTPQGILTRLPEDTQLGLASPAASITVHCAIVSGDSVWVVLESINTISFDGGGTLSPLQSTFTIHLVEIVGNTIVQHIDSWYHYGSVTFTDIQLDAFGGILLAGYTTANVRSSTDMIWIPSDHNFVARQRPTWVYSIPSTSSPSFVIRDKLVDIFIANTITTVSLSTGAIQNIMPVANTYISICRSGGTIVLLGLDGNTIHVNNVAGSVTSIDIIGANQIILPQWIHDSPPTIQITCFHSGNLYIGNTNIVAPENVWTTVCCQIGFHWNRLVVP